MSENPSRRLPELKPVERRTFLRYSLIGATGAGLAGFGASLLGFLWPNLSGGFGADITLPASAAELAAVIREDRAPFQFPAGRMYIVTWDPKMPGAEEQYGEFHAVTDDGVGLMALFQKCVHLGCRVPWCQTSQWFECPCHGSKYNRVGEKQGGPAPRGLDRFPVEISGGNIVVDTGNLQVGPPIGTNTTGQSPEGAPCV